ncbi:hypothetical protein [Arthrobacter agilis]|uniref:hypothetical protein n=1 Tax=Arthrobacter agilis TaxID=37921 RepID=UPI001ABFC168|nr:hypothetical protein [Arthrobacter agilis]
MKIKHNSKGYRELLRSQAMLDDVKARADRIAAAAGPGFEAISMIGKNRARASVRTTDIPSIVRNSRDQILLRALEAGRG